MDKPTFVVAPEMKTPQVTPNAPIPPKKPNIFVRFLNWVLSHKFQSIGIVVVFAIVVLVATVMATGKKVALLGVQINPLYQQASCNSNDPSSDCNPPANIN
ncbi:MAG TPA: hypothetical protein VHQ20_02150, partial [Patescibacteria group bacterium]|nr:hypothetical protein [Patescibacteria group bacterium]